MPLSPDEQRILAEIEENLHRTDPRLAREVGETTVYRHALGSLKWMVLWFVVGLALMVATLQIHYLLAFAGFMVTMGAAIGFERNLRLMGRAGIDQFTRAFRAANPAGGRADEDLVEDQDND